MRTASRLFQILTLVALLAAGSLATGCANAPASSTPPAFECNQLASEIGEADLARREALEQQRDAWKFVVPVAVVVRYAGSEVEVRDADRRLGDLRARFDQMQCASDR